MYTSTIPRRVRLFSYLATIVHRCLHSFLHDALPISVTTDNLSPLSRRPQICWHRLCRLWWQDRPTFAVLRQARPALYLVTNAVGWLQAMRPAARRRLVAMVGSWRLCPRPLTWLRGW